MADMRIVAGSSGPPLRFQVVEGDENTPVDLAEKEVRLRFAPRGQPALWERACTADVPIEGKAHYEWEDDDLVESGSYEAQVIVEYGSGMIRISETFLIDVLRRIPAPEPTP